MCLLNVASLAPAGFAVARRGQTFNNTRAVPRGKAARRERALRAGWHARCPAPVHPPATPDLLMQYEEQSRRLSILGGFVLGIAAGVGAGLLLASRPRAAPGSDAVRRARGLRAPTGRRLKASAGGAAGRMARKKFAL
jgi:hypothetical protein